MKVPSHYVIATFQLYGSLTLESPDYFFRVRGIGRLRQTTEPEVLLTLAAHARRGLRQSVYVYVVSRIMLFGGCIEQELWLIPNVLCYKGKILYQETLFRNALL